MQFEPIQYFNRYTGKLETENVYGERYLRWLYSSPFGRLSLHGLVKRAAFSRWYGRRMDHPGSKSKVLPFISTYGLEVCDFADQPDTFQTFNEFFYRKLKPSARPVCPDPDCAVFPADGRHLGFQDVSKMDGIFVKGAVLDLEQLLQNGELTQRYNRGSMILSRLCPVDYHRYHFPVGGVASKPALINGHLYSVNPMALRRNIQVLAENKRACCRIESEEFGTVLMFEVGATCVGSFEYTFVPDQPVAKGQEKGYFRFGGSLTITLFEPGRIRLDADLVENTARRIELYARMGDRMGCKPAAGDEGRCN